MDIFNNNVGITYAQTLSPVFWDLNTISDNIYMNLVLGMLRYLNPINYNDPNFWGTNGVPNINTATHGISSYTTLTQTNL